MTLLEFTQTMIPDETEAALDFQIGPDRFVRLYKDGSLYLYDAAGEFDFTLELSELGLLYEQTRNS